MHGAARFRCKDMYSSPVARGFAMCVLARDGKIFARRGRRLCKITRPRNLGLGRIAQRLGFATTQGRSDRVLIGPWPTARELSEWGDGASLRGDETRRRQFEQGA